MISKMSIPKKARKLSFNNQIWRWLVASGCVVVWSPTEEKHTIPKWKFFGLDKPTYYDVVDPIYPGCVRKYIETHIINTEISSIKIQPATLGKLYALREIRKSGHEGPNVIIDKIEPTGWKTANEFKEHVSNFKPVLLIDQKCNKNDATGYYQVLANNVIVTLKITWPRTFSGYFQEVDPEKYYGNEKILQSR